MTEPKLILDAGLDRSLAWCEGGSVRYLVADLSAQGSIAQDRAPSPALNLALAIDVSGSMAGEKLAGAKGTAMSVAEAMGPRDRLTIVAFDDRVKLLLDARPMDKAGRRAALAAIGKLRDGGNTNLSGGWLRAAEQVAMAQEDDRLASHRILLLSDGQANAGITSSEELAGHAGALLERGLITSCVGIGDGYDEALLGAMAEAGGGRLHDAADADEIAEVVLGELREGRATLLERAVVRLTVPPTVRAEVVGAWAHATRGRAIEVQVGGLLPARVKRVVFRLHCPAGEAGTILPLELGGWASRPDGGGDVEADGVRVRLVLADAEANSEQARDADRSTVALKAWQSDVLRRVVALNRDGDYEAASHLMAQERRWIGGYAATLPDADAPLEELRMVDAYAGEAWSERTRKRVFMLASQAVRMEADLRASPPACLRDAFEGR